MSILDMDVTTRRDAGSVRTREFATVRKGYDPDQVRAYLDQLSAWIEDLETDLAEARAQASMAARTFRQERETPAPAAPAAPQEDPYAALGSRLADVIRTAEEHAQRVRQEADASAERHVEEARQEALKMRRRAQEDSEALRQAAEDQAEVTRRSAQEEADRARDEAANALEAARVEAERTVASLSERRNALAAELQSTRSRLLGIVTQLEEDQSEPAPEIIWPAADAEAEAADVGVVGNAGDA